METPKAAEPTATVVSPSIAAADHSCAKETLNAAEPAATAVDSSMSAGRTHSPRKPRLSQPPGTVPYKVEMTTSFASIAAGCRATVSQLQSLNHTSNSMVIGGQIIYIPAPSIEDSGSLTDSFETIGSTEVEGDPGVRATYWDQVSGDNWVTLGDPTRGGLIPEVGGRRSRHGSSVSSCGYASGRSRSSSRARTDAEHRDLVSMGLVADYEPNFSIIKVQRCKQITSREGILSGTLMLTTNTLIFDPNVSDPLVLDGDREQYYIALPVDLIARMAIFKHKPDQSQPRTRSTSVASCDSGVPMNPPNILYRGSMTISSQCSYSDGDFPSGNSTPLDIPPSPLLNIPEVHSENSLKVQITVEGEKQGEVLKKADEICASPESNVEKNCKADIKFMQENSNTERVKENDVNVSMSENMTSNSAEFENKSGEYTISPSNALVEGAQAEAKEVSMLLKSEVVDNSKPNTHIPSSCSGVLCEEELERSLQLLSLGASDTSEHIDLADHKTHSLISALEDFKAPHLGTPGSGDGEILESSQRGIPIVASRKLNTDNFSFPLSYASEYGSYLNGLDLLVNMESGIFSGSPRYMGRAKDITISPLFGDIMSLDSKYNKTENQPKTDAENKPLLAEAGSESEQKSTEQDDECFLTEILNGESSQDSEVPVRRYSDSAWLRSKSSKSPESNPSKRKFSEQPRVKLQPAGQSEIMLIVSDEPGTGTVGQVKDAPDQVKDVPDQTKNALDQVKDFQNQVTDVQDQVKDVQGQGPPSPTDSQSRYEGLAKTYGIAGLCKPLHELRKPTEPTREMPWFLCVTVGKPLLKPDALDSVEKHHKRKMSSTLWFIIPYERVEPLYKFMQKNLPGLYGEDVDPSLRGLAVYLRSNSSDLIDLDDEELDSSKSNLTSDLTTIALPNLSQPSDIFSVDQIKQISHSLPACIACSSWTLCYSSADHGFSLSTAYRNLREIDSFSLLVIRDASGTVFGSVISCPVRITNKFIGSGQSYLFTFKDTFQKFEWTGVNSFIMLGNKDSLCIGSSNGRCSLWLDGDFHHGRTQRCDTFANDLLTGGEDFLIRAVEIWSFV